MRKTSALLRQRFFDAFRIGFRSVFRLGFGWSFGRGGGRVLLLLHLILDVMELVQQFLGGAFILRQFDDHADDAEIGIIQGLDYQGRLFRVPGGNPKDTPDHPRGELSHSHIRDRSHT